jgi:hypothetical protein
MKNDDELKEFLQRGQRAQAAVNQLGAGPKPKVQLAKGICTCGSSTFITRTPSPWEFDWQCPGCGSHGTISYAHHRPPPEFKGQVIDR